MDLKNYRSKNPVVRRMMARRAAQRAAEAFIEGYAAVLVRVLEARGFVLGEEVRGLIQACKEFEQLEAWLVRGATLDTLEEVFAR